MMISPLRWLVLLAVVLAALAGVQSADAAGGSSTVVVRISGLPAGVPGWVSLRGPKGFLRVNIVKTTTFGKRYAGTYRTRARYVYSDAGWYYPNVQRQEVRVARRQKVTIHVRYRFEPHPPPPPAPPPAVQP